ncbi:hypothetical protein BGZ70_010452 [Mortierella alpina]|uniref:Uncharacterized protein n=1 Tax=Mortierella alpina TaxID=64518 RepID=A0A9P6LYN1_MORAP|nr:hypothetical protein BGZ70_010452 [Mortierella alpina]
MKITSVILALSAVVALTHAQNLGSAAGALDTVKGTVAPVTNKLGSVTGAIPKPALRRRQDFDKTLDDAKIVAGQLLAGSPLHKRGVVGNAKQTLNGLTTTLPGLKRALPTDLTLTAESLLAQIKPITAITEASLVSGIKHAIEIEVGHVVDLTVEIGAELKAIVDGVVKVEIANLVAQLTAAVDINILATLHSTLEHLCTVLIPKVNALLQVHQLTEDIVLEVSDVADFTVEKVISKTLSITNGLGPKVKETVGQVEPKVEETVGQIQPKVDETLGQVEPKVEDTLGQVQPKVEETVGQVKPKVDEIVGQVKPKVDETLEQVKPKVDETVGQVKPKVDEIVGQVKPKVDETVDKVKTTIPLQAPETPVV